MIEGTNNASNVAQIVAQRLCIGCGTCFSACPRKAIQMFNNERLGMFTPRVDVNACSSCGLCLDVCPSRLDTPSANSDTLNTDQARDSLIGPYTGCYIGHSTDNDIRYVSSSGGLVTQVLLSALESKIVDGALVTRMSSQNPLLPEPFIARSRDEIVSAARSKYCPVPLNTGLRQIMASPKGERFAVVGLPCHIVGIRRMAKLYEQLRSRIVLHLGLVCSHTPNLQGTIFLLRKLGMSPGEVARIHYRGYGWPSGMTVQKTDGHSVFVPASVYWGSLFGAHFFTPTRCLVCADCTCELSDVSFGDAWLPEMAKEKMGQSIVLTRNSIGDEAIRKLVDNELAQLRPTDTSSLVRSQRDILYFKKKSSAARAKICRLDPLYRDAHIPSLTDYLLSVFPCINSFLSSHALFRRILQHIPFACLKAWRRPHAIATSIASLAYIGKRHRVNASSELS